MPVTFEIVGILLGIAIYNNVLLDIKFPRVIFKKLLREPLTLEDVAEIDPEIYKSLKFI